MAVHGDAAAAAAAAHAAEHGTNEHTSVDHGATGYTSECMLR